jgi:hypothetical protein
MHSVVSSSTRDGEQSSSLATGTCTEDNRIGIQNLVKKAFYFVPRGVCTRRRNQDDKPFAAARPHQW